MKALLYYNKQKKNKSSKSLSNITLKYSEILNEYQDYKQDLMDYYYYNDLNIEHLDRKYKIAHRICIILMGFELCIPLYTLQQTDNISDSDIQIYGLLFMIVEVY